MKVASFTCGSYGGGYCVLITDDVVHLINDEFGYESSHTDKDKALKAILNALDWSNPVDVHDIEVMLDEAYANQKEVEA